DRGVGHVLRRDHRREPADPTPARGAAARPGVRADAQAHRRREAVVRAPRPAGADRVDPDGRLEPDLLLGREGGRVGIDLRMPLGALFGVLGLLLTLYGAATRGQPGTEPTGVPIDLIWGVVLFAFGLWMLLLARRARRASSSIHSPNANRTTPQIRSIGTPVGSVPGWPRVAAPYRVSSRPSTPNSAPS